MEGQDESVEMVLGLQTQLLSSELFEVYISSIMITVTSMSEFRVAEKKNKRNDLNSLKQVKSLIAMLKDSIAINNLIFSVTDSSVSSLWFKTKEQTQDSWELFPALFLISFCNPEQDM